MASVKNPPKGKRKPTDRVQIPVRMLEAQRAKLEKSAKAHGISLNGEINQRLHDSLTIDLLKRVAEETGGTPRRNRS
jgi:hypothetical protein